MRNKEEDGTRERTAKVQPHSCGTETMIAAVAEAASWLLFCGGSADLSTALQATEEQAAQVRALQQQVKRYQQELAMRDDEVQAGADDVKHIRTNYQELQVRMVTRTVPLLQQVSSGTT